MRVPVAGKGSYVLIVHLRGVVRLRIGSLGEIGFAAGHYAYVGSAMGGLKPRLLRHVSKKKRARWHIDYLTNVGTVSSVVIWDDPGRIECKIADVLRARFSSVPGFGCGDCECPSHLFYASSEKGLHAATDTGLTQLDARPLILRRGDIRRLLD